MRQVFLADLRPGDVVDDVFCVSNAQLAASSNGKQYIKAFVSDRSAQLTARLWNATRETFNALPDNAFVRLRGRVENYQNNLQVIIEAFKAPEAGSYDVADLLPTTAKDIDEMVQRVFAILATIKHPPTKALIQAFLDDEALMTDFVRAPAASTFHHAYIGGLLEHTLNLLEIADRLVGMYPGLSRDLCLAGVFMHDIAKTWELTYDAAFNYSDSGQLIGHVVKAAMMIEEKARRAGEVTGTPLERELVDVIQHIVLSHHEKLEHGSPKQPATPEAVFVSLVDNLDAKVSMAMAAARPPGGAPEDAGNWTEFLKPFGYRIFRRDPTAPAPPPAPPAVVQPASSQTPPRMPSTGDATASPVPAHAVQPQARAVPPRSEKPPERPAPRTPPPKPAGPVVLSNPLFDLGEAPKPKK